MVNWLRLSRRGAIRHVVAHVCLILSFFVALVVPAMTYHHISAHDPQAHHLDAPREAPAVVKILMSVCHALDGCHATFTTPPRAEGGLARFAGHEHWLSSQRERFKSADLNGLLRPPNSPSSGGATSS